MMLPGRTLGKRYPATITPFGPMSSIVVSLLKLMRRWPFRSISPGLTYGSPAALPYLTQPHIGKIVDALDPCTSCDGGPGHESGLLIFLDSLTSPAELQPIPCTSGAGE